MTKRYRVELPIVGRAVVEVETDSPEAAIREAMQSCDLNNIEEWDPVRRITQGNVCYAPLNAATAEEVEG